MLTQLLQTSDTDTREGVVRVGQRHVVIPAGKKKEVKCGVRTSPLSTKQDVLFEPDGSPRWLDGFNVTNTLISLQRVLWSRVTIPVTNDTCHDITLNPCTVLGQVHRIRAVYPADVRPVDELPRERPSMVDALMKSSAQRQTDEQRGGAVAAPQDGDEWDPPVPVDHLPPEKQNMVKQLLREGRSAFARNDDDLGSILSLRLKV